MARTLKRPPQTEIERELLRQTVGALQEGQRCSDCRRTPLIGETLHIYADAATVCELCRPLRRAAPALSDRVHHSGYGGDAVHVRRISPR